MNTLKGAELENQYRAILERLGDEGGILGQIFKGAVNISFRVSPVRLTTSAADAQERIFTSW